MMSITHKSTGLGLEVKEDIWEETHTVTGSLTAVSNTTYEKTMFFDVDGKQYNPTSGNFGYTSKGSQSWVRGANDLCGCKFTLTETASPLSITAYFQQWGANTPNIKCAIYDDDGADGKPGTLLAYTEEWTLTAGWDGWKTFNITWKKQNYLDSGDYYLVVWQDGQVQHYKENTGATLHKRSVAYNSFPDPFGTPSESTSEKASTYCTYQVGYSEIPATKVKVANDYIKPDYARIIARASGDVSGTKKLKIHDGNADVAEVTWTATGVQDLVSSWIAYTDTTDRTMSVYFEKSDASETFTLYNVALEMRRDPY